MELDYKGIAAAAVSAVALPQVFHAVGAISGLGSALGAAFLPMYLPVLLAGLLAGPMAGAASGALAPLISAAMSGMPAPAVLPVILVELTAYGFFAGLLRRGTAPTAVKILVVQVIGKLFRAGATVLMVYGLGVRSIAVSSIWMSAVQGLPGLLLQLFLLPLIVFYVERANE